MKINFGKLNTKTLATLAFHVINSSKSNSWQVVEKHPLLLEIENQFGIYDSVYGKLTSSGKGTLVANADKTRDNAALGFRGFVKGVVGLPGMPNHQAAVAVWEVLNRYIADISKLNYFEETAQLRKLFEVLDSEEMQANLTALNILPFYTNLKQSQADFEAIYAEQAEANAELRVLPSASSIRKNLEKALRDYFNLLIAMKNVAEWKMIYAEINELVKAAANS
jgi:hypothetical protein